MRAFVSVFIAFLISVCLVPLTLSADAIEGYNDPNAVQWPVTDKTETDALIDDKSNTGAAETLPPTIIAEQTETTIPSCEHDFTKVEILELPLLDKPGLELWKCILCGEEENRIFVCTHENLQDITIEAPNCELSGYASRQCILCKSIIEKISVPATGHKYTDWQIIIYATPMSEGTRQKTCAVCDTIVSESYSMTMAGDTAIYIPGTGINHAMAIEGFTQLAVDTYDIVYTEDAYAINGANNPFVLGHNTGTLKTLHRTEIGQMIYISVNGEIETYEVVLSEYAIHFGGREMIGQETGINLMDRGEGKTLHLYTCHGTDKRGRWIVIASLKNPT